MPIQTFRDRHAEAARHTLSGMESPAPHTTPDGPKKAKKPPCHSMSLSLTPLAYRLLTDAAEKDERSASSFASRLIVRTLGTDEQAYGISEASR